jgi:epoxyqueuosine reductase
MDLKATICDAAAELGFERTVIGSLEPLETELVEFEAWLAKGYAAGMEYLKRNPHFRASPQLLFPGARSAIVVAASYYTEPPADPGPRFGRVARYAVGQDYHIVLKSKLIQLKERLEEKLDRPLMGRGYTDDVSLLEQAYAGRSGLGFKGKNTMIIGPKLTGSYHFIAELFTDLALEADQPYEGTCGRCFRCGDICPTRAITAAGTVDARLCISYLTIENKGGVPVEMREALGYWLFGCDLCQEVCPYNQRPPATPWVEFRPESGVGHFIDLLELLEIDSDSEFKRRFGTTPLSRPKRRGLLRNALVVLGNRRPGDVGPPLERFATGQPDSMLREHAVWALVRCGERRVAHKLYEKESDQTVKAEIAAYLD